MHTASCILLCTLYSIYAYVTIQIFHIFFMKNSNCSSAALPINYFLSKTSGSIKNERRKYIEVHIISYSYCNGYTPIFYTTSSQKYSSYIRSYTWWLTFIQPCTYIYYNYTQLRYFTAMTYVIIHTSNLLARNSYSSSVACTCMATQLSLLQLQYLVLYLSTSQKHNLPYTLYYARTIYHIYIYLYIYI